MATPHYSVVVPVFNSASTLRELCARIAQTFSALAASFEIVLVNDCSHDNSWNEIAQLKKEYGEKLRAISLRRNAGQHKALLCGFQFAQGEWMVCIDDDLQFFPEDIPLLIQRARDTNADMVYGWYEDVRRHSTIRQAGSRSVALLFNRFAHTPGNGTSFKLIHRSIIDKIKDYNHTYTFLDEVISWHSTHTEHALVRHAARKEGSSNYTIAKLFFWTINLTITYTTLPLRFMIWFGLMSFFICLGFVFYFLWQKIIFGAALGFTSIIVALFMSTGLILFSLGVIGEYLNRLFVVQNRKPPFLIQEVLK